IGVLYLCRFFFQAEDGIRDFHVTGVQTCALPIWDSAERAWGIYAKRYPELAGHQMVISEAVVRGKRYWRVSAGGFDNAGSQAMRSEERRVGKEWRDRWARHQQTENRSEPSQPSTA